LRVGTKFEDRVTAAPVVVMVTRSTLACPSSARCLPPSPVRRGDDAMSRYRSPAAVVVMLSLLSSSVVMMRATKRVKVTQLAETGFEGHLETFSQPGYRKSGPSGLSSLGALKNGRWRVELHHVALGAVALSERPISSGSAAKMAGTAMTLELLARSRSR
jgi:hypothetical protein